MKILILGCGMQGRVVARDLSRFADRISVIDIDKNNLSLLDVPGVQKLQFDITEQKKLTNLMSDDYRSPACKIRILFMGMRN